MEKYLRHCLDSLIVSNMDKVEVLVINDGQKGLVLRNRPRVSG